MQPQAGQLQVIQRLGLMNDIKNLDATLRQILLDPTTPGGFEQLPNMFVRERNDHGRTIALLTSRQTDGCQSQ
jgi:hypothetical protein